MRKLCQIGIGLGSKDQEYAALIRWIRLPDDEIRLAQAIHQFHRAVMADTKALRQIADGDRPVFRKALYRQHGLMLAGLQANTTGCLLAEFEETPQQVAEL